MKTDHVNRPFVFDVFRIWRALLLCKTKGWVDWVPDTRLCFHRWRSSSCGQSPLAISLASKKTFLRKKDENPQKSTKKTQIKKIWKVTKLYLKTLNFSCLFSFVCISVLKPVEAFTVLFIPCITLQEYEAFPLFNSHTQPLRCFIRSKPCVENSILHRYANNKLHAPTSTQKNSFSSSSSKRFLWIF